MQGTRRRVLVAMVCALLWVAKAHAQSTYGAVVGQAIDASTGLLPGATVTLTEVQTSFVRTTTTDPGSGSSSRSRAAFPIRPKSRSTAS
jgi:hypothetical protein